MQDGEVRGLEGGTKPCDMGGARCFVSLIIDLKSKS